MIRQDYLLRMIEEAGRMLRRLLELPDDRDRIERDSLAMDLSERFIGVSAPQLFAMDEEAVFRHLQQHGAVQEFGLRLGVAVNLIRAEATRATGDAAVALNAKAICLLARARLNAMGSDMPEFVLALDGLLAETGLSSLPPDALGLVLCAFEHGGHFAAAEDILFALREQAGPDPGLRQFGEAFYGRLLSQSDHSLVGGNLPRAEVEEGRRAWRELFDGNE